MPIELVKLTDHANRTHGNFAWRRGVARIVRPDRRRAQLCSNGVIHAYRSLPIAVLCDSAYGWYFRSDVGAADARLWRAETDAVRIDDGTKVGVWRLTLVERIARPAWSLDAWLVARARLGWAALAAGAMIPPAPGDPELRSLSGVVQMAIRLATSAREDRPWTGRAWGDLLGDVSATRSALRYIVPSLGPGADDFRAGALRKVGSYLLDAVQNCATAHGDPPAGDIDAVECVSAAALGSRFAGPQGRGPLTLDAAGLAVRALADEGVTA